MHIGACIFPTDRSIRPDDLARELEARKFESLFVPEHTHIPTSRRSPFAGGAQLPEEYKRTHDPFVGLMAAAAATKNLKVGTGICLLIERDTITTAKA
ncbi:MAG TPA: LLM class flavin-dependent oxidoreductase, partial [Terriglobales bacterium]|nr:LLM class flavin-dependent oxidoreductase [Terriglobales bacterium]